MQEAELGFCGPSSQAVLVWIHARGSPGCLGKTMEEGVGGLGGGCGVVAGRREGCARVEFLLLQPKLARAFRILGRSFLGGAGEGRGLGC